MIGASICREAGGGLIHIHLAFSKYFVSGLHARVGGGP